MTPLQRQRLIDGEMSHSERADLLNGLDKDPSQWKALAMGLLEELVWIQQFPKSLEDKQETDTPLAQTQISPVDRSDNLLPQNKIITGRWGAREFGALATAAVLFLAFGWFVGRLASLSNSQTTQEPGLYTAAKPPVGQDSGSQGMLPQGWTANSRPEERDSQRKQLLVDDQFAHEIPLLDAREVDPKLVLANEALEFAKLNQQLKRKGYQLDVQPQYFSGKLDDGRKVLVPVHNVSLKPYGL